MQFEIGVNNIKSDIVSAQVGGEWPTLHHYSRYAPSMAKINVMLVSASTLSHLDARVSSHPSVGFMGFIIFLHRTSISCLPFTGRLFSH